MFPVEGCLGAILPVHVMVQLAAGTCRFHIIDYVTLDDLHPVQDGELQMVQRIWRRWVCLNQLRHTPCILRHNNYI